MLKQIDASWAKELDLSPKRTLLHAAVWTAAGLVGLAAVLYARLVAWLQQHFFAAFHSHPVLVSCAGPLLFVLATYLVKAVAPDSSGSGIPQVLAAIENAKSPALEESSWSHSLVSLRTCVVKILSSSIGILGGASIGREGPTVQIAASVFAGIGRRMKRFAPQIDFQAFVIAGAAAGVASAFNTPIAGIAFALEEIAEGMSGTFRQGVMLAVIVAGIITQALNGNYLYFGRPPDMKAALTLVVPEALFIGLLGGLAGGIFALLLSTPRLTRLPRQWFWRALTAGVICSAIGYFTHGDTSGSGYEVTRHALEGTTANQGVLFPLLKLTTTSLSYLSGMAGGIFSPCLSIGAGIGMAVAQLAHLANFKVCALMGMVAFFSGSIRAPLTGVIIVMEMTDEHLLILPFMIAAYLANAVGRRMMPVPLYQILARRYLIVEEATAAGQDSNGVAEPHAVIV